MNLMDYSVLLGVHSVKEEKEVMKHFGSGVFSTLSDAIKNEPHNSPSENAGILSGKRRSGGMSKFQQITAELIAKRKGLLKPLSEQSYYGLDKHNVAYSATEVAKNGDKSQIQFAQKLMDEILTIKEDDKKEDLKIVSSDSMPSTHTFSR